MTFPFFIYLAGDTATLLALCLIVLLVFKEKPWR